ncbi:MAG: tyrosine-type recombinase/integrase [Chloroflexi bacterium]|nr:tyrosine-type recombinase/integrase [Chloroflexota bacterium]
MTKRARHTGSIQERGKGSWRLRYWLPPDADGKRKQATETVRGTKKQAEVVLRERQTAVENGGFVPKAHETVAGFMRSWLETYAAANTKPRTLYGYQRYNIQYIEPTIGGVVLQKLTPQHLQGVYAGMLDRGLSPSTIGQLHRIFKEALSHAVQWGILTRNVADATTPPKKRRGEMEMWDVSMINRFLNIAEEARYSDLYHLIILTGMRRAELCGLRWRDVDLDRASLSVINTWQRIPGIGFLAGHPKTDKPRAIALSKEAVKLMQSIRSKQIEHRLSVGPVWQDTGYVFTRPDGRPLVPDMVTNSFTKLIRSSDLPHMTLRGLRHAHATLLLAAGVHPKIVSESLGHSNIAITMDIYSHVLPGMQEAAAQALDERLAGGS